MVSATRTIPRCSHRPWQPASSRVRLGPPPRLVFLIPQRALDQLGQPSPRLSVGPRGSLPQGSHRSGHAQLTHPAPRVTGSLQFGKRSARRAALEVKTLSGLRSCGPSRALGCSGGSTISSRCAALRRSTARGPGSSRSRHSRRSAPAVFDLARPAALSSRHADGPDTKG